MTEWIPTIVATGALTFVWFTIRSWRSDIMKDVNEIKAKLACNQKASGMRAALYLTEKDHAQLCQIASLTIKEHFTHEITVMKDDVFKELRIIQSLIANGNDKTKK